MHHPAAYFNPTLNPSQTSTFKPVLTLKQFFEVIRTCQKCLHFVSRMWILVLGMQQIQEHTQI